MGKRCACERLFTRLETDVRLRTLPMAAQMLWLKLMRLAAETVDGVLHLGSHYGLTHAVSLAVSAIETEVETGLALLEGIGVIERGADGASLRIPEAAEAASRVNAARINGMRGGRPRKNESPEAARERRQGNLMLPVSGGRGETQETEREPNHESSRAACLLDSKKEAAAAARGGEAWVSLGQEMVEVARLDPARGQWSLLPVKGWMEAGATPGQIRAVITRIAERPNYKPPTGGLNYFRTPVMAAVEKGEHLPEAPEAMARVARNAARIAAMLAGTAFGPAVAA